MKNVLSKKLVSILMSIILVVLCLPVTVMAGEIEFVDEFASEQCMTYAGQKLERATMSQYLASTKDAEDEVVYSSYSLLSAREKEFYDKIVSTPVGTMQFTVNYTPYLPKAEFQAIDFTAIMYAVCLDHPEIFYYNGYSYGYSYVKSTGAVASVTYKLVSPKVSGTTTAVYSDSKIASCNTAMWNEFHRVAEELNLENCSRYTFVKNLHDYLCDSVTYVINNKSCFDPYGTLVEKQAVCQGYAETFKMFCDYYNIPVVSITGDAGGAHMWNAVLMEDGKWYIIDITWDDQSHKTYYDFFLIGLNTKDTYFTGKPFSTSHVSDGSPYLPVLDYALTAYETSGTAFFNQTENSLTDTENHFIYFSPFTFNPEEVYYNGYKITAYDFYTGDTITTPDGETWSVVIAGDVNGNGNLDVEDYQQAINKGLSGDHKVYTVYDAAADVCMDGYIDVLDVAYLHLFISGLRTDIYFE